MQKIQYRATKALQQDYLRLTSGVNRAYSDWQAALSGFNNLTEPKAVDVCIYQIQRSQSQYENLLLQLREVQRRLENLQGI